jgi:hypothetical protein
MKQLSASLLLCLTISLPALAQSDHGHDHEHNQKVYFPDIPGYNTITCDFHTHSVFSDGSVWPNIRVQEAVREGLDCISTTEHLEYQPHSEDIPHPDRNRSYELATNAARNTDLIVVNGSEITRSMPPGHTNAVFIEDANPILTEEPMDAFAEARKQGAFMFTNHPNWTSQRKDGIAKYEPMHLELIEKGMLHGIEVVNLDTYSEEALQLALDYDLTFIGTSDIHGLTDWEYEIPHGGHRPLTLVFSKERNKEGIRDGLFEHQTVVWFNDLFIGREEWIKPIMKASLEFEVVGYQGDTQILEIRITNPTHSEFILSNKSEYTFHQHSDIITIEPEHTETLLIKTLEIKNSVTLPFEFLNGIMAPEEHPVITYELTID